MKKLTQEQVTRIAQLAHVAVSEDDITNTTAGLESVLAFVDQLQSLDSTDTEPTTQVTGLVDVLREDVVVPSDVPARDLIMAAPLHEGDYIKVPRVIHE